jgi:hypothetical protein
MKPKIEWKEPESISLQRRNHLKSLPLKVFLFSAKLVALAGVIILPIVITMDKESF